VAEPLWRDGREEVTALDEHVGRDRDGRAGGGLQQRAVVTDAERRAARRPREEAIDELEFAEVGHGREDYPRPSRSGAAKRGEPPVRQRSSSLQ